MTMKYNNLQNLLQSEHRAMNYFDALPENVRENISERATHIHSFSDLEAVAENLIGRLRMSR